MMMKTVGAFLLVGGVTAAGLVGGSHLMQAAMAQGADPYRTLDTLAQALHHIEDQYIEPHPTGLLVEGAITGMTEKLDAHSTYLDPDDLKAAQVRTEGVYSGVGLELKTIDDAITVVRVVPGSPADGRVARGAQLTAVDGVSVERLSEASAALRGSEGTDVRLKLRVGDDDETLSLKRQRIRDRTVRVEKLSADWAYAEIARFQRNTADDLRRGLEGLQPKQGLIIDVRGNGGGLLDEAVATVDLFTDRGMIVQTMGRDEQLLERHEASAPAPFSALKVIVLIDGESASASEIVAGALRELHGAVLVGTESYGKWSVQRMYVFEDKSALKLTIARYEITESESPEATVGLTPDHLVNRPGQSERAAQALRMRLSRDAEALAHLDALLEDREFRQASRPLAPLSERLTLDPQLKKAWTLARANP